MKHGDRDDNEWHSCCMRADRRAVQYFSQLGISVTVILFCIHQMSEHTDCDSRQFFSSLLTLCVGWFVPSPAIGGGN